MTYSVWHTALNFIESARLQSFADSPLFSTHRGAHNTTKRVPMHSIPGML
jgi:hypothetical protein